MAQYPNAIEALNNDFIPSEYVIYVEDEYNEFINDYITKNYDKINARLALKGIYLIYFPMLAHSKQHANAILDFLRYKSPILYSLTNDEILDSIHFILKQISPSEFYSFLISKLGLPTFKKPAFLRSIYGGMPRSKNFFSFKPINSTNLVDLESDIDEYLNQVRLPNDWEDISFHFDLAEESAEYDADWNFGWESKKDTEELKQKIDKIKSEGKFGVLAEAIMYMLETIKDEKPEILKKVKPLIEREKLLESKVILSPILIDKHYKIFLPDFGNIEVKMHALPKTVYLLFLRYPKGIRFKELYQYKTELLEIYYRVTNKYDKDEIRKAINDLVDMTNPSINQKCARIREAFRNIMDEHVAKYYYIDGQNGEAKKISLPQKLVDIRY